MERTTVAAVEDQAMFGQTAELPLTSIVDRRGRIVDKIDYPFVNDPNALGYWQSVDFVRDVCEFTPEQRSFRGDLFLKELYILPEGKANWAFTWTAGLILHHGDKTASRYILQTRGSDTYMFLEWKSGDYVFRHQRPSHYVLKKGPDRPYVETRVTDRIDYPFVDDPNVIGTWKVVDLVDKPSQFRAGRRHWLGDLVPRDQVFLPGGRMQNGRDVVTWTHGLVLHRGDHTASAYAITRISGATYMFLECKNGDYIRWRMDPKHFVLKKEESSAAAVERHEKSEE
jgi:bla regulator protein blaR1